MVYLVREIPQIDIKIALSIFEIAEDSSGLRHALCFNPEESVFSQRMFFIDVKTSE
jgi:hypothetical protein